MGELIPESSLIPTQSTAMPAPAGMPLPAQGFTITGQDLTNGLTQIKDIVQGVKEIMAMRAQLAPPAAASAPPPQQFGRITEAIPPLPSNAPTPQATEAQPMKPVTVTVDRNKLRLLLEDLIVKQSEKLPADIKAMKIEQLIGENFKTFNYMYAGSISVDGAFLLGQITEQLANQIDKMLVVKEAP